MRQHTSLWLLMRALQKQLQVFFRDHSDTVFFSIYVPIIYSEGINFDWHNGWKCWTLASKNFERRRATQDFKNGGSLEMLTIAKLVKIKVLLHPFWNLIINMCL